MLTVKVAVETPLSPERVIEGASDFTDRRAEVWQNVRANHLEVHERGDTCAEVTEGTWLVGLFWERSRYDWSQPGSIKQTVIDSNVFEPGSTWELRATPRDGGSEVEMVLNRDFRKGVKGRIASAFNHSGGPQVRIWGWRWILRRALAAIEKQET